MLKIALAALALGVAAPALAQTATTAQPAPPADPLPPADPGQAIPATPAQTATPPEAGAPTPATEPETTSPSVDDAPPAVPPTAAQPSPTVQPPTPEALPRCSAEVRDRCAQDERFASDRYVPGRSRDNNATRYRTSAQAERADPTR